MTKIVKAYRTFPADIKAEILDALQSVSGLIAIALFSMGVPFVLQVVGRVLS